MLALLKENVFLKEKQSKKGFNFFIYIRVFKTSKKLDTTPNTKVIYNQFKNEVQNDLQVLLKAQNGIFLNKVNPYLLRALITKTILSLKLFEILSIQPTQTK